MIEKLNEKTTDFTKINSKLSMDGIKIKELQRELQEKEQLQLESNTIDILKDILFFRYDDKSIEDNGQSVKFLRINDLDYTVYIFDLIKNILKQLNIKE
jgi:hypothetical protein